MRSQLSSDWSLLMKRAVLIIDLENEDECNLNNIKYLIRHSGGLRPVEVIYYLLWVCMNFLGAANKQMVDLTYLCFVFLNDRSGAWWEIQWAACQRRNNSLESPPKLCVCVCALLRSVCLSLSLCLSRPPPSLYLSCIIGCGKNSCFRVAFLSALITFHWLLARGSAVQWWS